MEINSPEIISGNHVTDFSGNPNEINSTNKKAAGNILEEGVVEFWGLKKHYFQRHFGTLTNGLE